MVRVVVRDECCCRAPLLLRTEATLVKSDRPTTMLPADESPVSYSCFAPLRHLATTAPIPLAGWDSSRFAASKT